MNVLKDDDWIVHLDEETYVLESALLGIFKFTCENKHPIGQGLITYGKRHIVSWLNTIADSARVLHYTGTLYVDLKFMHKSYNSFNGSFFVVKKSVESAISFDFGPQGTVIL